MVMIIDIDRLTGLCLFWLLEVHLICWKTSKVVTELKCENIRIFSQRAHTDVMGFSGMANISHDQHDNEKKGKGALIDKPLRGWRHCNYRNY